MGIQADVTKWAKETFPQETHESKIRHMFEEIEEAYDEITNLACWPSSYHRQEKAQEELADIASILLNHSSDFGIEINIRLESLAAAIKRKLEINKKRTWGTGADGVCRHIKNIADLVARDENS